jgi:hypothetical protein
VHEGAAQRDQRSGKQLAVAVVAGGRYSAPQAVEAGVDRARGHGRFAGLHLRQHGRPPGDPRTGRYDGRGGGLVKRWTRIDPELALEELRACRGLARRRVGIARGTQAAHEKDVRVFVERVEPHELGGVIRRLVGFAAGKQCKRGLVEHRGRRAGDVAALVLEPCLEAGA